MKIGIVGNGMIVGMFLKDAQRVKNADICSLCVRPGSVEKGKQLIAEYKIPKLFTDYDDFFKDPEIETVYLGISNLVHFEYAKKALEAGKHVICEKPFTVTGEEARELSKTAQERSLFLWEAFLIPYSESWKLVKEHLCDTGNVKLVQTNYCKTSSRYKKYLEGKILPAFDLSLAGGALYDLNIYNLHFVIGLFGKPKSACYYPVKGYNGVDTSGIAVLSYPDFQAVCCAAKDSSSPSGFSIQGEDGTLLGEGSVSALRTVSFAGSSGETTLAEFDGSISLAEELTEFIRQYEQNDYDSCYGMLNHSVAVAETVDDLLKR